MCYTAALRQRIVVQMARALNQIGGELNVVSAIPSAFCSVVCLVVLSKLGKKGATVGDYIQIV
jgi:hypothetical protein